MWIGSHEGMLPREVARELAAFQHTLQRAVAALDARYPDGQELDGDGLAAVIDLCADACRVGSHPPVRWMESMQALGGFQWSTDAVWGCRRAPP